MLRLATAATCVALLSSIIRVASLPTLYDVESGEGILLPLDTSDLVGGFAYEVELQVSVIPADKGATVTQYEIHEMVSDVNTPVSGQALGFTTIFSGPVTRTYTMDQGASTLHYSKAPAAITTGAAFPLELIGVVRDCSLDLEKKEGVCVDQIQQPLLTTITESATTVMSTYTTSITTTYTRPLNVLNFTNAALSQTVVPAALSAVIWVGAAVGMLLV